MRSYHVGIAAEAFAAGMFARCGCDVLVQYGVDQPEYDLVVGRAGQFLKVSVKGSQDGSWGLTQSFLENADYHAAIDTWLAKHHGRTALCLVQFKSVAMDQLPRVYLAWPAEIARRLRETAAGRGDTILYEQKTWSTRAHAAGTSEQVPSEWHFSEQRLDQFLATA